MNVPVADPAAPGGPTVHQVLRRAEAYLDRHGVEGSAASAELLLAHVLGTDRAALSRGPRTLSPAESRAFGRALCRRCQGAPVQHLTGEVGFRHLVLQVGPGVFIPRPETEVLVEVVLAALRGVARPKVVDVGTGTGAIALSIKDERPDARVIAVDRALEAVRLAGANAARLGLDVEVVEGDLLTSLPIDRQDPFDAVISNPPYVAASDHGDLPADVKADPYEALVGDPSIYANLARQASDRLAPGGVLGVEIE
ncbi:MAG TPA: peptide chain release factor N(5)-glutamine methyltransferase, partial [Actinomycetota bacterium]